MGWGMKSANSIPPCPKCGRLAPYYFCTREEFNEHTLICNETMIGPEIEKIANGFGIIFSIVWHTTAAEWVYRAEARLSDGQNYWLGELAKADNPTKSIRTSYNIQRVFLRNAFDAFARTEREVINV